MTDLLKRLRSVIARTRWVILLLVPSIPSSAPLLVQGWAAGHEPETGIAVLFPPRAIDGSWEPIDSVRVFRGDDLFDFIDGGAPIFLEYGFRQAAIRRYALRSGSSLVCEAYEMEGPASAFGIFTSQNTGMDRGRGVGDGAVFSEYYVSFWKGRYFILVSGEEESEETQDAMMRMARSMEERVEGRGALPALVRDLPVDGLGCDDLVYIRGDLGLANTFVYGFDDMLGVEEGITLKCPGASLAVLSYTNEVTAADRFNRCREWIKSGARFAELEGDDRLLLLVTPRSSSVRIEPFRRFLLLAEGDEREELESLLQKVKLLLIENRRGETK